MSHATTGDRSIRTVLIDDEQPARVRLSGMLAEYDDLDVVGEACDGREAISIVDALQPDLVFLDIQMPGLSGLEVAASLTPPRPRVIFCTAFDQYAIDAFEHHASDYLLKPVNRKRLGKSIERVRTTLAGQRSRARDVADASRTQARLLPRRLPPMRGLEYAGACRAAHGVGGDYYDFLALGEDRLGIALGDVSGKGMFAGLLVAGLQARIQSLASSHVDDIGGLVGEINRSTVDSVDSNRYATLFYGVYDDDNRSLRYVNAGHNPPLVLKSDGTVERLAANGTVVGLLPDSSYAPDEVRLDAGDLFVLFSDGVTEARDIAGAEYGESRLRDAVRRHAERPVAELVAGVLADVGEFSNGMPQHDDISLVVARASAR